MTEAGIGCLTHKLPRPRRRWRSHAYVCGCGHLWRTIRVYTYADDWWEWRRIPYTNTTETPA